MRESRTYGSVRGAGSNLRPYRDRLTWALQHVVRFLRYRSYAGAVAEAAHELKRLGSDEPFTPIRYRHRHRI